MALLFLTAATLIWAGAFIATKVAMPGIDIPLLVLLRFLIGGVFWLPGCWATRHLLTFRRAALLLGIGFLTVPGMVLLNSIALRYTTAASLSLLFGAQPLLTVLLGHFFWKEKARAADWIFCLVIAAGIFIIVGWPHGLRFFGCLLSLLAGVSWVCGLHVSKQAMRDLPAPMVTVWSLAFGTLLLVPCAAFLTRNWHIAATPAQIGALFYLGFGCSALAYALWNAGLRGMAANQAGLFLGLEQIAGVFFAAVFLGERLSGRLWAGGVLVVVPILCSAFRARARTPSILPD